MLQGTTESRVYQAPPPTQTTPHHKDKPALAALASYSVGFANLGLQVYH